METYRPEYSWPCSLPVLSPFVAYLPQEFLPLLLPIRILDPKWWLAVYHSNDPATHAVFWAEALGYGLQPPPPGFASWEDWAREFAIPEEKWGDTAAIVDPDGIGPRLLFLRVPEPKTAKNRMHLDINIADRGGTPQERRSQVDAEVERLEGLGATRMSSFDEPEGVWTVMLDPEGNEFCVH